MVMTCGYSAVLLGGNDRNGACIIIFKMGMAIAGSEERGGGLVAYAQAVVAPWLVGAL